MISATNAHTRMTEGPGASKAGFWAVIPGGPFTMGADRNGPDGEPNPESPAHTVHVDTFRMAIAPVSVGEFARFVEATGYVTTAESVGKSWVWRGDASVREPGQDHLWFEIPGASWAHPWGPGSDVLAKGGHPVTHVSFTDCLAYCEWAHVRLPTEAEWEKAARGTDGRPYTWGDKPPDPSICNYNMHVGDTTPIGSYPESTGPFGLQDAAGNVWEWTSTAWHRYPYGQNEPRKIATRFGSFELGVVRGGSFFNDFDESGLLVYMRVYSLRNYTSCDIGFRVCITGSGTSADTPGTASSRSLNAPPTTV
jgi:sulfatase modifying factor 1